MELPGAGSRGGLDYKEAQSTVLKLIDRYSVAGNPMALSYNNQADFVARIPPLIDDAMGIHASTVRKIPCTVRLSTLPCETVENTAFYTLPEDCVRVCPPAVEGAWLPDEGHIALPCGAGEYLTYYRRPQPLGENPEPRQLLDGTEEMQRSALYYAAACLMLHEDDFAYKMLLQEWERHLSRLATLTRAEVGCVQNVYGEGET